MKENKIRVIDPCSGRDGIFQICFNEDVLASIHYAAKLRNDPSDYEYICKSNFKTIDRMLGLKTFPTKIIALDYGLEIVKKWAEEITKQDIENIKIEHEEYYPSAGSMYGA